MKSLRHYKGHMPLFQAQFKGFLSPSFGHTVGLHSTFPLSFMLEEAEFNKHPHVPFIWRRRKVRLHLSVEIHSYPPDGVQTNLLTSFGLATSRKSGPAFGEYF
jgi:hypothetical protein